MSFRIKTDGTTSDVDLTFFSQVAEKTNGTVEALLAEHSLSVAEVEIFFTSNVMSVSSDARGALGNPPETRSGIDRVGGIVAGKTLLDASGLKACIYINPLLFDPADSLSTVFGAFTIVHEFGHVLHDVQRHAAIGATEEVSSPWDLAGMFGLLAANEFRADQLACLILPHVITLTDGEGRTLNVSELMGNPHLEGFEGYLDVIIPGLPKIVHDYRTRKIDLVHMWNEVARISGEAAILCAHVDALRTEDQDLAKEFSEHRASELISKFWTPVAQHLKTSPMIPSTDGWAEDRATIWELSRAGWLSSWESLGIRASAEGDHFRLDIDSGDFPR